MQVTTISSQRQVTIPKRFLDQLNVVALDKLLMSVEKDVLVIKPQKKNITDQLAGSWTGLIKRNKETTDFKKVINATKKIVAKQLANE